MVRYRFEALKAEARAQGLTQSAIARRARINQQRVSRFFLGQQQGPRTAQAIARVLNVDLRDFVVLEEDPERAAL